MKSMANTTLIPVILSGGTGSRLWPLSRALRPKQFLSLTEERSLFQLTLDRLAPLFEPGGLQPIVVANDDHRFLVAEQCRAMGVKPQQLILEPMGRNTAPAIAIAALAALETGTDPVLLVLPSDHVFEKPKQFIEAVKAALPSAQAGQLVTFGIVPSYPETGYGYIRSAAPLQAGQAVPVAEFVEKPNSASAEAYLAAGNYTWNSGMFLMKASTFLQELKRFQGPMYAACEHAWNSSKTDLDFTRLEREAFAQCPAESIDYAVMEKTDKAMVIPLDAGWNDVGAWSSVWNALEKDAQGNAVRGDTLLHDVQDSYVYAEHRLVSLVGVKNLVVIETADAVLVLAKDRAQDVKRVVDQLKAEKRPEVDAHREVFRPWGSYDSVDRGGRFQVKRITVNPGAKLSLQMHHHRAEHWVVVSGTARVRIGEVESMITENQSVYIPIGAIHSLENPGKTPLEIIEVQSGSYLGEDDIVRFEDRYGRA
jgi:mannose-1-phosphate guanylyltransferase/mannose-6-phosphate isomerase